MLKKIVSADGKRYAEIASDDDKVFRFTEYAEVWDEGYGEVPGSFYWEPTHCSGLYDSAAAAEADARSTLPWLRGDISN